MTERPSTSESRRSWFNIVLVLAASAVFGLTALPRLQPSAHKLRGQEAPDFALPVLQSADSWDRVRLSDLRGKVVLLDFWASWCGVCRNQAPILDEVARQFRSQDLVVLGVNTGDQPTEAMALTQRLGLSYRSLLDGDGSVAEAYRASALPTLVLIDSSGRIAEVRQGLVRKNELERLVQQVLSS
ncbi:TlpA family protein disulfide reductase [Myxococcota bacterium]